MVKKILITGGTGFIGSKLTQHLTNQGYNVCHLSQKKKSQKTQVETFLWDVENSKIDERCIEGVETIVHLAGAGIADKRWTSKRKEILIKSRTDSIALLYDLLRKTNHQVRSIISASGSGYYSHRGDQLLQEDDDPSNDFLAECCILWEKAVDEGNSLGIRVVKLRTGMVLDKDNGALPKLSLPIKLGVGANLGNGKQWVSWIHIQDAIAIYTHVIENLSINGAYNMSSPNPVTQERLNKAIAQQLKKPLWLPDIPSVVLKVALGEMSTIILGSTKMDSHKIQHTGFRFSYPDIASALENIYESK